MDPSEVDWVFWAMTQCITGAPQRVQPPQRVQSCYRSVRKADPKKSRLLASAAGQMQAFLISLTEKICDSENDLSEQMIPLLVREIYFIRNPKTGIGRVCR
jgi:hypothetical protein